MIKVTYEFYCDICNEEIKGKETVRVPVSTPIPKPYYYSINFGMHLCEACNAPILEAIIDTRKKRSPC